jgi:hypothetical protein
MDRIRRSCAVSRVTAEHGAKRNWSGGRAHNIAAWGNCAPTKNSTHPPARSLHTAEARLNSTLLSARSHAARPQLSRRRATLIRPALCGGLAWHLRKGSLNAGTGAKVRTLVSLCMQECRKSAEIRSAEHRTSLLRLNSLARLACLRVSVQVNKWERDRWGAPAEATTAQMHERDDRSTVPLFSPSSMKAVAEMSRRSGRRAARHCAAPRHAQWSAPEQLASLRLVECLTAGSEVTPETHSCQRSAGPLATSSLEQPRAASRSMRSPFRERRATPAPLCPPPLRGGASRQHAPHAPRE